MPSPSFHIRRRIRTPNPRLLSEGRCRSPSPSLEELKELIAVPPLEELIVEELIPSPPLEELMAEELISSLPPLEELIAEDLIPPLEEQEELIPSPPLEEQEETITSPPLEEQEETITSPPLEEQEEPIVAQIILMFAMEDPRPDPAAVKFLVHELKTVGLPYHVIFNKIDLVKIEVISQWEERLENYGCYDASFVSLKNHLGVTNLHNVLSGRSSLVVGLHGVGKTSLVDYVARNRANDARCDVSTVIKKADKWLAERCDVSNLVKEDLTENPSLHPYCLDLYEDINSRSDPLLVCPKSCIVQRLLESDQPTLDDMVQWVSSMENAEEHLYFMKHCPEDEHFWWKNLTLKGKEMSLLKKKLDKDYQWREVMDKLLMKLYKACFEPFQPHDKMLRELLRLVNDSPKLCSSLADGASFIATAVTLMLVGQEPTKIATAHLLYALADSHYTCKVLTGELGGFHGLAEMIQSESAPARKAGIQTLCVLVAAEENWKKALVTGVPEAIISMLAKDGEAALPMVSKAFIQLGSFELAWKRFFTAAHENLNMSVSLYNAVMKALLRIKHSQNLRLEFLEGSMYCERDNETLELEGVE